MIKQLFLFFSLVLSSSLFAQKPADLELFAKDLQARISWDWEVRCSEDKIQILYHSSNEIYEMGCCTSDLGGHPKGNKLLKWLRNDYLKALPIWKFDDTLKIELNFTATWSELAIDSMKVIQDSINESLSGQKVVVCNNYYWTSSSDKQVIPFYSTRFDCSVFFTRPEGRGIFELEGGFDIPHLVNIDDKILMIQQITALLLEIDETCFTCICKEE